jgi:hypothetical protein
VLSLLANDSEEYVREAVAECEQTPLELLAKLALDEDEDVRGAVHSNSRSTDQIRASAALLGLPEVDDDDD